MAEGVPGLTSKAKTCEDRREEEFQTGDQLGQRGENKRALGRGTHFIDRRECSREGLRQNFKFRELQRASINNLVRHEVWKGYLKY